MQILNDILTNKKERIALFFMLEFLHMSIWLDFGSPISRSFMLSHLGLFLIWQPVWHGDEKLSLGNILLFTVFTVTITAFLNSWLLFAWLILLTGFISGRVTFNKYERITYILSLVFIVIELLFASNPLLVNIEIQQSHIIKYFLPLLPVVILFLPVTKNNDSVNIVDLIHALTASMMAGLVAMGSLLTMFLSGSSYFAALAQTSIAIGGFILCISWLLISQPLFSSASQLWSKYMLNIGTPFEEWLGDLSILSEKDLSANEFLFEAMHRLLKLPWVSGIKWSAESESKLIGNATDYETNVNINELEVCIFTHNPASASLKLHCNLLIKLLNNFYINKQREQELTRQAHLKAIYETGARITHDIKNLVQSLQAITSIVQNDSDDSNIQVSQQVLKKQLPGLTQRLQLALDKLQTPEPQSDDEVFLKDWLNDVRKRNSHLNYTYQSDIDGDPLIPVDLFDSVIDNLLENIHNKRLDESGIEVTITVVSKNDINCVMVCDTGTAIPENISRYLLSDAISSDNGLGIGLYQANKHANMFDYKLELIENRNGKVCFELSNR